MAVAPPPAALFAPPGVEESVGPEREVAPWQGGDEPTGLWLVVTAAAMCVLAVIALTALIAQAVHDSALHSTRAPRSELGEALPVLLLLSVAACAIALWIWVLAR